MLFKFQWVLYALFGFYFTVLFELINKMLWNNVSWKIVSCTCIILETKIIKKKAHRHILLTNFDFLLVLVVISALLTYPLGFSSPFFRYYCGGAGVYNMGQCSVGWSYMLAIMGVALSVFCPILWSFRWIKRDDVMDEVLVWPLPSNNHKENTFSSFHFSSDLPKTF